MEVVKVKAKFGNTSRRFEIASDIQWCQLEALLQEYFDFPPGSQTRYLDDEGELVLLSSQGELEEAFRLNKKSNGLLRLFITVTSQVQESSHQQIGPKQNVNAIYNPAKQILPELQAINTPPPSNDQASSEPEAVCVADGTPSPEMLQNNQQATQNRRGNQSRKKGKNKSCYVNLAEVMAAELAELTVNKTTTSSQTTEQQAPADQTASRTACRGWFGTFEEPVERPVGQRSLPAARKNCYAMLGEEMAKEFAELNAKLKRESSNQEQVDKQSQGNSNEEEQHGQLTIGSQNSPASPLCTPMVTPTQGCYTTLATAMAPDLAAVNAQLQRLKLERANAEDASRIAETQTTTVDREPPGNDQPFYKQKRPKRSRKHHPKKKGCYAQLAEDMAPDFAALNAELMKQMQENQQKEASDVSQQEEQGDTEDWSFVVINPEHNEANTYQSFPESENQEITMPCASVTLEQPLLGAARDPEDKQEALVEPCSTGEPDMGIKEVVEECIQQHLQQMHIAKLIAEEVKAKTEQPSQDEGCERSVKEVVEECLQQHLLYLRISNMMEKAQIGDRSTTGLPKQGKVVHKGIVCDNCENTILGVRYKCCNCADYDLCETCEDIPDVHDNRHAFIKLKHSASGVGRKHGEMVSILKSSPYKEIKKEQKQKEKQERKEEKRASREQEILERKMRKEEEKREHRAEKEERRTEKTVEKEHGLDELWVREQKKCGGKEWKKQWKDMKRVHKMEKHHLKIMRRRRAEMRMHEELTCPALLPKPLSVKFVDDASYPDGSFVLPGQKFEKRWIVKNDGALRWSHQLKFEHVEGTIEVDSQAQEGVITPELGPGEQREIAVEMTAPMMPGSYDSKWQFVQDGKAIGPQFWCDIVVPNDATVPLVVDVPLKQDYPSHHADIPSRPSYDKHSLSDEALTDAASAPRISIAQTPDEATADSASEYMSSEEAPAGVSSSGDSCVVVEPLEQTVSEVQELDWDATGCDIDNDAYTDSSDDFMVVPVPPCFHPDTPLNADPIIVTVSMRKCEEMTRSSSLPSLMDPFKSVDSSDCDALGPNSLPSIGKMSSIVSDDSVLPLDQELQAAELPSMQSSDGGVRSLTPRGPSSQYAEPEPIAIQPSLHSEEITPLFEDLTTPISTEPFHVTIQRHDNDQAARSPPISIQPSIGSEDAVPAPEPVIIPSTPVTTVPSHVTMPRHDEREEHRLRRDSGDFPGNVVSDALATAIDAVATAGRAAMATVENFIGGNSDVDATATYRPEESDVEVSIVQTAQQNMDAPAPPTDTWHPRRYAGLSNMDRLIEMGFGDRRLNQYYLNKHNNDLQAAINDLLSIIENDWHEGRH